MLLKQIPVVFLLLIMWKFTYSFSCFSLLFPIIVGGLLFKTSYEYKNAKKQCLAGCYFKDESFLYKLFTRKFFIFMLSIIGAIILSIVLMLNVVVFTLVDWIILFLDSFFIFLLYKYFSKNNSLKESIKEPIIKNSVAYVNSFLLMILFFGISLIQTPPSYIQNELLETIRVASNQIHSNCQFIDFLVGLSNEVVAMKWWIMLKFTLNIHNHYLKELMWIIYLIGNFVMLFAFSKLNLEVLNIVKRFENE